MEYPTTAIQITFKPLTGKRITYRIWLSQNKWLWNAAGNSGFEETQELAMAAARRWILTTSQAH